MKWVVSIILVLALAGAVWYLNSGGAFGEPASVARDEAGVRIPSPDAPISARAFNGIVVAVEGNVVRVMMSPPPGDVVDAAGWVSEREVVVGRDTKVFMREVRSPEEYQKALDAFAASGGGEYPERYVDTPIAPGELRIGQTVGIEAFDDVLGETRFEAMTIRGL